jgi:hypothetical protein
MDIRDGANGIWHEEPMGFRRWFILYGESLAVESWTFAIQSTFGRVETFSRVVMSSGHTPNVHRTF